MIRNRHTWRAQQLASEFAELGPVVAAPPAIKMSGAFNLTDPQLTALADAEAKFKAQGEIGRAHV